MNLEAEYALAMARTQAVIDAKYDRIMASQRFQWAYARRSMAQRLRNDKREQRYGKTQGVGIGVRHG